MNLTSEVDAHPHHHVQSRNGPARQLRREKRAAACEAAAPAAAASAVCLLQSCLITSAASVSVLNVLPQPSQLKYSPPQFVQGLTDTILMLCTRNEQKN